LIAWFESATKEQSFIEGAAAINLAAEGQVPGAFAPFARALERRYGLTREQVAFWDLHEEADREHSDVGDHIVTRHATTDDWQERIRRSLIRSLISWWEFFDDIERRL
jgi:pyrroloquinoline quinone (PQQ) biosynthesis protein C